MSWPSVIFRLSATSAPSFASLRSGGSWRASREPISLVHEMTEVHRRVLGRRRPGALVRQGAHAAPTQMPVLANLFGTAERVAAGFGVDAVADSRTRRNAGRPARARSPSTASRTR